MTCFGKRLARVKEFHEDTPGRFSPAIELHMQCLSIERFENQPERSRPVRQEPAAFGVWRDHFDWLAQRAPRRLEPSPSHNRPGEPVRLECPRKFFMGCRTAGDDGFFIAAAA
jgi:hypothetical protein